MRRILLSFLAFAVLGVFMMPGEAVAHEGYGYNAHTVTQDTYGSATYAATSQSTHVKPEASALKTETVAKSVSPSQKDDCKDGCCSMSMCCFSAAIPPYSLGMNVVRDAFDAGLPELSLPQGPPSSLLRPPQFSA